MIIAFRHGLHYFLRYCASLNTMHITSNCVFSHAVPQGLYTSSLRFFHVQSPISTHCWTSENNFRDSLVFSCIRHRLLCRRHPVTLQLIYTLDTEKSLHRNRNTLLQELLLTLTTRGKGPSRGHLRIHSFNSIGRAPGRNVLSPLRSFA